MDIIFKDHIRQRWLYAQKGTIYNALLNNNKHISTAYRIRKLTDFYTFPNILHGNVKQENIFIVKEVFHNPRQFFYS